MGNFTTKLPPLELVPKCETAKFMGTWFVVGNIPTYFETNASNAVEKYTFLGEGEAKHDVNIDFQYNDGEPMTSKLKSLPQKGWIEGPDKAVSSKWKVSPFWPIKLDYPIIELDEENYSYCVIGYPSRQYLWIMSRLPAMKEETYDMIVKRCVDKHGYDVTHLRKVPQKWTLEEREKRGLTSKEIPDDMLVSSPSASS
jgi:apolipoprotein D and lipocalin family protein